MLPATGGHTSPVTTATMASSSRARLAPTFSTRARPWKCSERQQVRIAHSCTNLRCPTGGGLSTRIVTRRGSLDNGRKQEQAALCGFLLLVSQQAAGPREPASGRRQITLEQQRERHPEQAPRPAPGSPASTWSDGHAAAPDGTLPRPRRYAAHASNRDPLPPSSSTCRPATTTRTHRPTRAAHQLTAADELRVCSHRAARLPTARSTQASSRHPTARPLSRPSASPASPRPDIKHDRTARRGATRRSSPATTPASTRRRSSTAGRRRRGYARISVVPLTRGIGKRMLTVHGDLPRRRWMDGAGGPHQTCHRRMPGRAALRGR